MEMKGTTENGLVQEVRIAKHPRFHKEQILETKDCAADFIGCFTTRIEQATK